MLTKEEAESLCKEKNDALLHLSGMSDTIIHMMEMWNDQNKHPTSKECKYPTHKEYLAARLAHMNLIGEKTQYNTLHFHLLGVNKWESDPREYSYVYDVVPIGIPHNDE